MPRMLVILMIAGLALALAGAALADASPAPNPVYRGLGLTTPFPNQTVRAGEPVTLTVTVKNYGLPPQVVNLSVVQRAAGWSVTFEGGGRPIGAVSVPTDQETTLTARLEPPSGARRAYRPLALWFTYQALGPKKPWRVSAAV